MRTLQWLLLCVAGILFTSPQLFGQVFKSDDLLGFWLNEEKDAKIEIYKSEGKYYGKIIWLEEPNEEDGTPKIDDENSDESLRNRPVMGLVILNDFIFDGEDVWEDGNIYDPKNGKTYKCRITMENINFLYIRGYIGKAWMGLGRTTEWTRDI